MLYPVVLIAVFASCLPQGEAIKCHSCTSLTDPKCGDPIDSSETTVECTPEVFKEGGKLLSGAGDAISGVLGKLGIDATLPSIDTNTAFVCLKAVKQDGDKKLVIRSCTLPKSDKFDACEKMKEGDKSVLTFCETCEKEGCNGSTTVVPSSLLLLLLAAVAAYFVKN